MTLICYANKSSSSSRFQHTYTITIANASQTLNMHLSPDDPIIVFDVFKNFMLNCSISKKFKIHWFKNDQAITESAYFRDNNKEHLHIDNATDLNEGVYKCAVKHTIAGESQIILYQIFKLTFKPYWSKWSQWSRCQPKCGKGRTKRRFRICHRSKIQQSEMAKLRCHGENVQRKRCATTACGGDGVWTEWSDWSGCSRTCGIGQMFRHRECADDQCDGPNLEIIECFRIHCAENTRKNPDKSPFLPFETDSRSFV